jgi:hypothetical protein
MDSLLLRNKSVAASWPARDARQGGQGRPTSTWSWGLAEVLGSVPPGMLRRESQVWSFIEADGASGVLQVSQGLSSSSQLLF